MVKMIAMIRRKKGLTIEEFSRYWYEQHVPLVLQVVPEPVKSGWRGYIHNYAVRLPGGGEPPFDGIAESYFDDLPSFWKWSNWYFSDDAKTIRDDEKNFIGRSKMVVVVTEEKTVFSQSNTPL